jgi:phosphate transport system permease protein
MTETGQRTDWNSDEMQRRIARRYSADSRFKWYGLGAIFFAMAVLVLLLGSIIITGIPGFTQTQVQLDVTFDPDDFQGGLIGKSPDETEAAIASADFAGIIRKSLLQLFPDVTQRRDIRDLTALVSSGARQKLSQIVRDDPTIIGSTIKVWLPTSDDVHTMVNGSMERGGGEADRRLNDKQVAWLEAMEKSDTIRSTLSTDFFTGGDSREPEMAGVWGAVVGSFWTLMVTLVVAFPLGVLAAVYLEEFAPKNRWSDLIEVNINNLAAVPSIVFGLLGLAVYLNVFHLPRSAAIVGGLTLALMTMPVIIIAARAALKAVPPSIRAGATGLGASRVQVTFHHVLPLAMPGIMTGVIIGMAHALGETAPLLMIGMVAFIVDIPGGFTDAATVLPVQIYLWADSPERAFVEKTSAAIMVLLTFLILMNAVAVLLRKRFERKW